MKFNLSTFERLSKARTRGEWYIDFSEASIRVDSTMEFICDFNKHKFHNTSEREGDAIFIAYCGTYADEMISYVKKLEKITNVTRDWNRGHDELCKSMMDRCGRSCRCGYDDINSALKELDGI